MHLVFQPVFRLAHGVRRRRGPDALDLPEVSASSRRPEFIPIAEDAERSCRWEPWMLAPTSCETLTRVTARGARPRSSAST